MSDTSQGDGWWQASDGKFYAPEAHPDYKPPPPPPPPPADVDESKPKGLLGKVSAADKPPFWRRRWVLITGGILIVLIVIGALTAPAKMTKATPLPGKPLAQHL